MRDRRRAIDTCPHCDETGLRIEPPEVRDYDLPAVRCDHTPMPAEAWLAHLRKDER